MGGDGEPGQALMEAIHQDRVEPVISRGGRRGGERPPRAAHVAWGPAHIFHGPSGARPVSADAGQHRGPFFRRGMGVGQSGYRLAEGTDHRGRLAEPFSRRTASYSVALVIQAGSVGPSVETSLAYACISPRARSTVSPPVRSVSSWNLILNRRSMAMSCLRSASNTEKSSCAYEINPYGGTFTAQPRV